MSTMVTLCQQAISLLIFSIYVKTSVFNQALLTSELSLLLLSAGLALIKFNGMKEPITFCYDSEAEKCLDIVHLSLTRFWCLPPKIGHLQFPLAL